MGQSYAGVARMQQTILNSAQDRCQTPTSTHTRRRRALNFIYFGDANLPLSSPSRSELISFMFHLDRHQHHGSIHYASNQPSPSDHLSFILPASGAFRPHRATHDPSDSSLTPACLKRVRCAARRCLLARAPKQAHVLSLALLRHTARSPSYASSSSSSPDATSSLCCLCLPESDSSSAPKAGSSSSE